MHTARMKDGDNVYGDSDLHRTTQHFNQTFGVDLLLPDIHCRPTSLYADGKRTKNWLEDEDLTV